MKRIDIVKCLKISIGCILGYFIAEKAGLTSSTSAAVITLLSILNTRRDTLSVARKRFLAFLCAAVTAWIAFTAFEYSLFSLGVYLLTLGVVCQYLKVMEGFSMSTVLMLHIWKAHSFTLPQFLNEFALMTIGIFMAVLMNLYMPSRIAQIRRTQDEIEALMQDSLYLLANRLRNFCAPENQRIDTADFQDSPFPVLQELLENTLLYARYTEDNRLFRRLGYYTRYVRMRMEQVELLKRIDRIFLRLDGCYLQTKIAADFMDEIAESINERNNARDLLDSLAQMREKFRKYPLPTSRPEFESRAVLFEIVNHLHELLLIKQEFAQNLSEQEIRQFWSRCGAASGQQL